MSPEQMSIEFDMLTNNISSNRAPGHTAYEKSMLLTQGQESFIKKCYSGVTGPFEKTEEVTEYLRTITKQADFVYSGTDDDSNIGLNIAKVGNQLWEVAIPEDLWFKIYEQAILTDASCNLNVVALVNPVTHDEFFKVSDSPFKGANRRRVLELTIGDKYQLFSSLPLVSYSVRYLQQPENICLPGLTANDNCPESFLPAGYSSTDGYACKLPDSCHRAIVLEAAQLAKTLWI